MGIVRDIDSAAGEVNAIGSHGENFVNILTGDDEERMDAITNESVSCAEFFREKYAEKWGNNYKDKLNGFDNIVKNNDEDVVDYLKINTNCNFTLEDEEIIRTIKDKKKTTPDQTKKMLGKVLKNVPGIDKIYAISAVAEAINNGDLESALLAATEFIPFGDLVQVANDLSLVCYAMLSDKIQFSQDGNGGSESLTWTKVIELESEDNSNNVNTMSNQGNGGASEEGATLFDEGVALENKYNENVEDWVKSILKDNEIPITEEEIQFFNEAYETYSQFSEEQKQAFMENFEQKDGAEVGFEELKEIINNALNGNNTPEPEVSAHNTFGNENDENSTDIGTMGTTGQGVNTNTNDSSTDTNSPADAQSDSTSDENRYSELARNIANEYNRNPNAYDMHPSLKNVLNACNGNVDYMTAVIEQCLENHNDYNVYNSDEEYAKALFKSMLVESAEVNGAHVKLGTKITTTTPYIASIDENGEICYNEDKPQLVNDCERINSPYIERYIQKNYSKKLEGDDDKIIDQIANAISRGNDTYIEYVIENGKVVEKDRALTNIFTAEEMEGIRIAVENDVNNPEMSGFNNIPSSTNTKGFAMGLGERESLRAEMKNHKGEPVNLAENSKLYAQNMRFGIHVDGHANNSSPVNSNQQNTTRQPNQITVNPPLYGNNENSKA